LFDSINAHYAVPVVEYLPATQTISDAIRALAPRCRILIFENEYDSHEWIASQNLNDDDVVAEADQALLGDMLHYLGKPGIGAADEGIGAVMRLLPLGLSLFRYPADISSLQSYLQSPISPLSKLYTECKKEDGTPYYASTLRRLFRHICSEGGFGQKWDEIIDGSVYAFDGTPLPSKVRETALKFIGMWELSMDLPEGEAPTASVTAFINGLDKWAGKNVNPDSEFNAQFMALQRNCATMLRLLCRWKGDSIPVKTLCRWASHVCKPIDISSDYARLGSINVISNVADIYSPAKRLIWFAGTKENTVSYEYGFLTPSEVSDLRNAGLLLPQKEQVAQWDKAYKFEGLSRCDDIVIVSCERISGVETVRSALFAEIADCVDQSPGKPVAKTETGVVETDLGKSVGHRFDPKILDAFSRKEESYSSINSLLMTPVDYLLDYVKVYRQYGIDELADIPTTEGNVAHAYIETLGAMCSNDPKAMLIKHREDYDSLFERVLSEKGLVMYLEANMLENKSFRAGLKESVGIVLGIIIENGLAIKGFEYELTADIPNIGPVFAKIDCLLRDPSDGKYVIIDFKYNPGKTYFNKIEENRELQLAVYRKLVEEKLGEVKFIGYYAIPRKKLYTPDNTLKDNPAIEAVPREYSPDILEMALKGYVFRWNQLRSGWAEEGEDLALEELDYYHQPGLYPLEVNYDDKKNAKLSDEKKRKARAYGDKNITLKGGLN
jgi:hypothetical protein